MSRRVRANGRPDTNGVNVKKSSLQNLREEDDGGSKARRAGSITIKEASTSNRLGTNVGKTKTSSQKERRRLRQHPPRRRQMLSVTCDNPNMRRLRKNRRQHRRCQPSTPSCRPTSRPSTRTTGCDCNSTKKSVNLARPPARPTPTQPSGPAQTPGTRRPLAHDHARTTRRSTIGGNNYWLCRSN